MLKLSFEKPLRFAFLPSHCGWLVLPTAGGSNHATAINFDRSSQRSQQKSVQVQKIIPVHSAHITLSSFATDTMASKHTSRALRNSLRQLSAPRVQQRTFAAAANASRPMVQKVAGPTFVQQARGKKTVDFAGDKEVVYGMQWHLQARLCSLLTIC